MHKIPTTVFTGFLGSGKTTIISHLIDSLIEKGEKVAYVKNEIGDVNIDGQLMKGKNIQTRELLSGCICCTLTGPFYYAINELVDTIHPDRILIEASGVADPATVALMISSHEKVLRDGVIAIIDVVNFEGYKNLSLTAKRQAEFTDLIVFNKVELVDIARKQAVVGYVRELNDFAPIVEAPHGILNPELVFGLHQQKDLEELLAKDKKTEHHHLEDEHIETFRIESDVVMNKDSLEKILTDLPPNVIRIKGFTNIDNQQYTVNKVGHRLDIQLSENQNDITKTTLVFIGFGIKELAEEIQNKFQN